MRELEGDIFDPPTSTAAICIPTNGEVRARKAVMGAGVALAAKARWPGIEYVLGAKLTEHGNHVFQLTKYSMHPVGHCAVFLDRPGAVTEESQVLPFHVVSFPTKHSWQRPSTQVLIRRSAVELRHLYPPDEHPSSYRPVVLPRVGCGRGGLSWDLVRPILQEVLPEDRYMVLHKE